MFEPPHLAQRAAYIKAHRRRSEGGPPNFTLISIGRRAAIKSIEKRSVLMCNEINGSIFYQQNEQPFADS